MHVWRRQSCLRIKHSAQTRLSAPHTAAEQPLRGGCVVGDIILITQQKERFMKLTRTISMIVFALTALSASFAQAELPPLIAREVLFGNPERTNPHLSPDGAR